MRSHKRRENVSSQNTGDEKCINLRIGPLAWDSAPSILASDKRDPHHYSMIAQRCCRSARYSLRSLRRRQPEPALQRLPSIDRWESAVVAATAVAASQRAAERRARGRPCWGWTCLGVPTSPRQISCPFLGLASGEEERYRHEQLRFRDGAQRHPKHKKEKREALSMRTGSDDDKSKLPVGNGWKMASVADVRMAPDQAASCAVSKGKSMSV